MASILSANEKHVKHGCVKWQTICNAVSGVELVDAMDAHLEKT